MFISLWYDFMSYELFFIDDEFGTITQFYGVITDEELIKCTKERYASQARNEKFRYIINDYSACTEIAVSTEAVKTVAKMAIDVSQFNKNIVISAALPSDLAFGLGRMWQAYADKTGWRSHAFRTRKEAEDWVQEQLQQELKFNR